MWQNKFQILVYAAVKKTYVFFTLFVLCWLPNLITLVLDATNTRLPTRVEDPLIEFSYICLPLQAIFAIIYWISLYKNRKREQVANPRLNLVSVLLSLLLFFVSFNDIVYIIYRLFFY